MMKRVATFTRENVYLKSLAEKMKGSISAREQDPIQ